jgi:hypothetical protein
MREFKIRGALTLAVKRGMGAVHAEPLPAYRLTKDILINHHMTIREQ